jgi:hypothetical protein
METVSIFLSPFHYEHSELVLFSFIVLNYIVMALEKFFPKYLAYISFFIFHDASSWAHLSTPDKRIDDNMTTETGTTH